MKKFKFVLKNNADTKEFLNNLKQIYVVVFWAKYAVLPLYYTGINDENGIPLVYDHCDDNGTCDEWRLKSIFNVTSGGILCWTTKESAAKKIAYALNKICEDARPQEAE